MDTPFNLKEVSFNFNTLTEDGTFKGYASVFNVQDSYGDIVRKGAFTSSIEDFKAKGKMPKMLWQHDRWQPIGIWTSIKEDDKGLYVEGRLLVHEGIQQAKEAYALIKAGVIDSLSIGYIPMTERYDADNDVNYVLDVKLKEISLVTFPANENSTISEIKQANAHNKLNHSIQLFVQSIDQFSQSLNNLAGFK